MKKTTLVLLWCVIVGACSHNDTPSFVRHSEPDSSYDLSRGDATDCRYALPQKEFDRFCKRMERLPSAVMLDGYSSLFRTADSISLANNDPWTLRTLCAMFEKRYYSPDSPHMNDELYDGVLDIEARCKSFSGKELQGILWNRTLLRHNAVGQPVSNVPIEFADGYASSLPAEISRRTLLLLYDSSCGNCADMVSSLGRSSLIDRMAENGELDLIAVRINEDDSFEEISELLPLWRHCGIAGASLSRPDLDLRVVPSIYIVSGNGIVRLKAERSVKGVENFLRKNASPTSLTVNLENGEKIWGGKVADGAGMPLAQGHSIDFYDNSGNQVQPLLLTDKGRYVWCNGPFRVSLIDGKLEISDIGGEIDTGKAGDDLATVYRFASSAFFPADGKLPPLDFIKIPQYNTWIELLYDQNQEDVLSYAHGIIDNGLPPGIIMIDDTWQEDYGKWVFHPGRFPEPETMIARLHEMGFKIMLWVCPVVSMDQYLICREINSFKGFLLSPEYDGCTWEEAYNPYPMRWWNGTSAVLDFSNEKTVEWFKSQLDILVNDYGVDGFKFDGADFYFFPADALSKGGCSSEEQCGLFAGLGMEYPYNEYRACWKMAGHPLVQRLHDKEHSWTDLSKLIPEMITEGLSGYAFSCPDMVGGGSFECFLNGEIDQEIIVRSAQCHALMPMMQFSLAPWRVLDRTHYEAVLQAVSTRRQFTPLLVSLAEQAARTGEPVVKPLEYVFPHSGYENVTDQYMLGDTVMVAPMLHQGNARKVILPEGDWLSDDGMSYSGPDTLEITVPLNRLPYFMLLPDNGK